MNNRHRRITKLRKQELNAAKAKFAREYEISAEQVIKLVDSFIKAITETAGNIFQSIGKAFYNIGTSLLSAHKEKEENNQVNNIKHEEVYSYNVLWTKKDS